MEWNLKKDKFTYILRYYLPCEPQYDISISDRRAEELLKFCKSNSVDAVMFYVDLNPYWYYMPDSTDHNQYLIKLLTPVADILRKNGISYQLNYQNLFGSWDGNFDHRDMLPYEYYVDEFGHESMGCACMIGERFRAFAGEKLRAWAETKPDAIWIDDDIRYHNHKTEVYDFWSGRSASEGMDFGCFCPNHIKIFNEKNSLALTREEIVSSVKSGGKYGKLWKNFLNDTLTDTSEWMARIVHSVSPNTKLALMTSNPDVHAIEGRDWNTLLTSLSDGKKPLLRPTFGPYSEKDPRDFSETYRIVRQLEVNADSQYKGGIDLCPEIENTRFTVYSKSAAATSYQIAASAFLGYRGVTLSIFDLEGVILEEEPEYGEILRSRKKFCDRMTAYDTRSFKHKGIAFITSPDRSSAFKEMRASRLSSLVPARTFEKLIAKAGIAYTYTTPDAATEESCFALDRYAVSILTDEELLFCLGSGTLLDLGAADEICKRGFGKHLGLSLGEAVKSVAASEHISALKRSDGSDVIIPSRILGYKWRRLILNGAEALSYLTTPGGDKFPGFTFYENSLGGRISVYAAEDNFGDAFFSNYRIKLLKDIIDRLSPDTVRANIKSYGTLAVKEKDNVQFIFLANLGADAACNTEIILARAPKAIELLTLDGELRKLLPNGRKITIDKELPIYNSVVLRIEY